MKGLSIIKTSLLITCLVFFYTTNKASVGKPDNKVFCFYYNWYGNDKLDGKEVHWAHPVMKQSAKDKDLGSIPGKNNLASNFFPQLKNYSSNDPQVVAKHMEMMADARIGVVVLTWWRNMDLGLKSIPLILDEANKKGLKVSFHLEPYGGRSAKSVRDDIQEILKLYGKHPAFYRNNGKPWFFIYDSYLTGFEEWTSLLKPDGKISIRNTPLDVVMIGLWVKKGEEEFFEKSGFDGFYTYFGATNFTYGSSPGNWNYMQNWAMKHDKIFIPCVGPGYIDTRVRPWNAVTIRDRDNGKYYDNMFGDAIRSKASYVGITSFNEWHEGTQIEPAIPFKDPGFNYLDYSPLAPDYYLKRTAYWVDQLAKSRKAK